MVTRRSSYYADPAIGAGVEALAEGVFGGGERDVHRARAGLLREQTTGQAYENQLFQRRAQNADRVRALIAAGPPADAEGRAAWNREVYALRSEMDHNVQNVTPGFMRGLVYTQPNVPLAEREASYVGAGGNYGHTETGTRMADATSRANAATQAGAVVAAERLRQAGLTERHQFDPSRPLDPAQAARLGLREPVPGQPGPDGQAAPAALVPPTGPVWLQRPVSTRAGEIDQVPTPGPVQRPDGSYTPMTTYEGAPTLGSVQGRAAQTILSPTATDEERRRATSVLPGVAAAETRGGTQLTLAQLRDAGQTRRTEMNIAGRNYQVEVARDGRIEVARIGADGRREVADINAMGQAERAQIEAETRRLGAEMQANTRIKTEGMRQDGATQRVVLGNDGRLAVQQARTDGLVTVQNLRDIAARDRVEMRVNGQAYVAHLRADGQLEVQRLQNEGRLEQIDLANMSREEIAQIQAEAALARTQLQTNAQRDVAAQRAAATQARLAQGGTMRTLPEQTQQGIDREIAAELSQRNRRLTPQALAWVREHAAGYFGDRSYTGSAVEVSRRALDDFFALEGVGQGTNTWGGLRDPLFDLPQGTPQRITPQPARPAVAPTSPANPRALVPAPPSGQAQVAPPAAGAIPAQPEGVPPGSAWSPSRQMWRAPSGQLFDAQGRAIH